MLIAAGPPCRRPLGVLRPAPGRVSGPTFG